MNRTLTNTVIAGWLGFIGLGQAGQAADAAESGRKVAVHVRNYAQVAPSVLERAGKIATDIFQKAGVDSDVVVESEEVWNVVDATLPLLCHLYVDILPRDMAVRLGLPINTLGLAPGTSAVHDRTKVFILDHIADEMVKKQDEADKAEIVGHAIAHEIGHILLNTTGHSYNGVMQANWDRKDMEAMTVGGLAFDSEQVGRIQAEVARRNQQQEVVMLAAAR